MSRRGRALNASRPYTNPFGEKLGACVYCCFCDRFQCPVDAKASPRNTLPPSAERAPNVEVRTKSRLLRVAPSEDRRRATGVVLVDPRGQERFQPADLVVLSSYSFGNVHLMLHSGIGRPYDAASDEGVVGRSYSYHVCGGTTAFCERDIVMNRAIVSALPNASVAVGVAI
ncbi:MAG: hypothetical protein BGP06_19105 [Rhizobiales bacterium 65-9]|nr:MAG: hypothetical protein BGP06_19105 [Rhizobiales bacterium 65-9]